MYKILAACLLAAFAAATVYALDDQTLPESFYDGDSHAAKTIGNLTVTNIIAVSQSQSVTNGQTGVSLTGVLNVIAPSTGAGTNTIALAAPGTANLGRVCIIQVHPDTTNLLAIADSGTVALSAAFAGGAGDTLGLVAASTGTWSQVFTSNN